MPRTLDCNRFRSPKLRPIQTPQETAALHACTGTVSPLKDWTAVPGNPQRYRRLVTHPDTFDLFQSDSVGVTNGKQQPSNRLPKPSQLAPQRKKNDCSRHLLRAVIRYFQRFNLSTIVTSSILNPSPPFRWNQNYENALQPNLPTETNKTPQIFARWIRSPDDHPEGK